MSTARSHRASVPPWQPVLPGRYFLLHSLRRFLRRFLPVFLLCWLLTLPLIWSSVSGQVKPVPLHTVQKTVSGTAPKTALKTERNSTGTGADTHISIHAYTDIRINGRTHVIQPQWLLQNVSQADTLAQQAQLLEGERILYSARQHGQAVLLVEQPTADARNQNALPHTLPIVFVPSGWQDKGATFWLHVFFSWAALAVASLVWAYEPNTTESRTLAAACICFALLLLCSVSQLERQWAIPPARLLWRYHLSHLFAYLCFWFMLLMAWRQPSPIGADTPDAVCTPGTPCASAVAHTGRTWRYWYPCAVLPVLLLARMNELAGWLHTIALVDALCTILVGLHILFAVVYQILKARSVQPSGILNRAALSWVSSSLMLVVILLFSLQLLSLPGLFNLNHSRQELNITASMGLLVIIIGFAGITLRRHLHALQSIWLKPMHVFASVYGLALGLWLWPALSGTAYTWNAIISGILGAVLAYLGVMFLQYRDIRDKHQQLIRTIGPTLLSRETQRMPSAEQQKLLESLLQAHVQPVQLRRMPLSHPTADSPYHATLGDCGTSALLLGITHNVQLLGNGRGRRLFGTLELSRLRAISQMARQGMALAHAQRRGQETERKRIAGDLQDSIGGKLLDLTREPGSYGAYAQNTLENLALLTRSMDKGWELLADMLASLRHSLQSNCEVHHVHLHTQFTNHCPAGTQLDSAVVGHIGSICTELIRNALQHSGVEGITLALHIGQEQLQLTVENDGDPTDPAQWKEGLGIVSMRRRFADLGGSITWHRQQHAGVRCTAAFPIAQWLRPDPDRQENDRQDSEKQN